MAAGRPPRWSLVAILGIGAFCIISINYLIVAQRDIRAIKDILDWGAFSSFPEEARIALHAASASAIVIVAISLMICSPSRRRDRNAQDLPYYLGFIGTLSGLFFAAVFLFKGDANAMVPMLVAQNGIALTTTLVGLIARNILRYVNPPPSMDEVLSNLETDLRKAAERAAQAGAQLRQEIDGFTASTKSFADELRTAAAAASESQPRWDAFGASMSAVNGRVTEAAGAVGGLANRMSGLESEIGRLSGGIQQTLRGASTEAEVLRETIRQAREAAASPPPETARREGWSYARQPAGANGSASGTSEYGRQDRPSSAPPPIPRELGRSRRPAVPGDIAINLGSDRRRQAGAGPTPPPAPQGRPRWFPRWRT